MFIVDLINLFMLCEVFLVLPFAMGVIGKYLFDKVAKKKEAAHWGLLRTLVRVRYLTIILMLIPALITAVIAGKAVFEASEATMDIRSQCLKAESLKIRTGGFCHHMVEEEHVLIDTSDPEVIQEFVDTLSTAPHMDSGACACCGDLSFEFYSADKMIYGFSLHHRRSIRVVDEIQGNLPLTSKSQQLLAAWLSSQGIEIDKFP